MIVSMITNMMAQQAQAARDREQAQQLQRMQDESAKQNAEFMKELKEQQTKMDADHKEMMKTLADQNGGNTGGVLGRPSEDVRTRERNGSVGGNEWSSSKQADNDGGRNVNHGRPADMPRNLKWGAAAAAA